MSVEKPKEEEINEENVDKDEGKKEKEKEYVVTQDGTVLTSKETEEEKKRRKEDPTRWRDK